MCFYLNCFYRGVTSISLVLSNARVTIRNVKRDKFPITYNLLFVPFNLIHYFTFDAVSSRAKLSDGEEKETKLFDTIFVKVHSY